MNNLSLQKFEHAVLDAELKWLNATGNYVEKKKANVITIEMEEVLWENGLLGDHTPEVLSNTLVYMIGFCFTLRSGEEHRRLHHNPSQIKLVNRPGCSPYLHYKEDISKTNQAGLHNRKCVPKEVIHHVNKEDAWYDFTSCTTHIVPEIDPMVPFTLLLYKIL